MIDQARIQFAARAAAWHFAASIATAFVFAGCIFGLWYPYPYWEIAGGGFLFALILGVDVVCGPLLTLILFSPAKSRRELALDLSLIICIQIAALAYGGWSLAMARPVFVAFEVDRFRVVAATDIQVSDLPDAPAEFQTISWSGPVLIGTKLPRNGNERLKSLELSLQGQEPGSLPGWWQPYSLSTPDVLRKMKPLDLLRSKNEKSAIVIDRFLQKTGLASKELTYLPLVSQKRTDWVVILNSRAEIVGFAPIDGF